MMLKRICLLAGLLVLPALALGQSYSWTDEEGNVHYGDSIPPEYRDQEQRTIRDGVEVDIRERARTEEEKEELRRQEELAEEARRAEELQQQRDERLLRLYGSVDEIERLRDDRVQGLQSQIQVTASNLEDLEESLVEVEGSIESYQDRDEEVPEHLQSRKEQLSKQVDDHQRHLLEREDQLEQVRERFAREIDRFTEITEDRGR